MLGVIVWLVPDSSSSLLLLNTNGKTMTMVIIHTEIALIAMIDRIFFLELYIIKEKSCYSIDSNGYILLFRCF